MAIQTKDAILKYLKDAIDQETAIVQQEQLIQQADAQHLQIKPSIRFKDRSYAAPKSRTRPYFNKWTIFLTIAAALIFFLGFALGLDVNEMTVKYHTEELENATGYSRTYHLRELEEELKPLRTRKTMYTIGLLCLIPVLINCIYSFGMNKQYDKEYSQELSAYKKQEKLVEIENSRLRKIYNDQLKEWEESFLNMQLYMKKKLDESCTLLTSFYAADVIYPKYRTLPALTSIYEYFITGRCDELTGPHGAYNLYEDELRKDTVISQLNTVIENLEQIKQNQYMLYQQVKAIQENTAAITYELQQIKGYTIQIAQLSALNAYYAALNEQNTRITMYYHL